MSRYYFYQIAVAAAEKQRRKMQRRTIRDASNPFELPDAEFHHIYRVRKELAVYLCDELNEDLRPHHADGLPVHIKVLTSLHLLGDGSYQRGTGQDHGLSIAQSTVSHYLGQFVDAVNRRLMGKWIMFPGDDRSRRSTADDFFQAYGLPHILGVIDCTQVKIFPPPLPHGVQYLNRKGVHSLNVQLIADVNCKIIAVNARFPGRVHDSFIFNNSAIKAELKRLHDRHIGEYFLLGDSGYALEPWLMTPVLQAAPDSPEQRYTRWHCRVRNTIERTNGYLKNVFRCLGHDRVLHYSPEKASALINTCCVLYNIMQHFSALLAAASPERRFPDGFKFGAASSSYQIEGGWNASDKGESVWDRFVHTNPSRVIDISNGDVACDSYHLWREDIRIVAETNLDFYRFSISWPRLLPTGFPNRVSEDGARYYRDLIDGLLERGIEPVVTLYHSELPQRIQDLGGWANPLIADWFTDYARVIFDLYGDRVKTWLTINEPTAFCDFGYIGLNAPGVNSEKHGTYLCTKNVLLAHAKAYRLYQREYKPKYNGQVSLANLLFWFEPNTENDMELTKLAKELTIGRYTHPVFSAEGGWPPFLEQYMAEKSKQEGHPRSRLPAFTKEEIELVRGSYDFFGLNHYATRTVRAAATGEDPGVYLITGMREIGVVLGSRPDWNDTSSEWFKVHPEGIRKVLVYLKEQYGNIRVFISENGFAASDEALDDQPRVDYYREYMAQVLLAMKEDGVNVTAYTAWTLMDNFEWLDGYTSRFGLHHVDFSSPPRARTPRRSARYYAQVARTHDIDAEYDFVDAHEIVSPTKGAANVFQSYVFLFVCVLMLMK